MSYPTIEQIVADIRPSEQLDRIIITGRKREQRHELVRALTTVLPNVHLSYGAEGISVSGRNSPKLLEVSISNLDLRWAIEARLFAENRRRIQLVHASVFKQVKKLQTGGRVLAKEYLSDIRGLRVLDNHQWVNVAAMTVPNSPGLCVFDEQGAGKTVTTIFAFDVLFERDEADFALIIAPKSMVPEWQQDFRRFKSGLYKVGLIAGDRQEKLSTLAAGADVFITNYETPIALERELWALLKRHGHRAILVVDESFFIKNLDARRTQALRRLREWCGRAYVLCGTPAPNAPIDLVQQFNIVDFGMTFEAVDIPADKEDAQHIVQQAIEARGLYIRHLKSEVLPDLPTKTFHRTLVELQSQQTKLYEAALQGLVHDLEASDEISFRKQLTSFLARRSALLQLCSNPTSLVQGYEEVPAKLLALDQLLEDLIIQRGEKVVVWSFYTASLDAIVKRFARFGVVRYDGSVTDVATRREAIRKFQEDNETMLFVGNPAAAGAGITLHRARIAVYESMSNQGAHYLQSLDRIHRRGQTREVEYIVLLCNGTIEINEYERLIQKERAAHSLLQDPVEEPVTRESMLNELLAANKMLKAEK